MQLTSKSKVLRRDVEYAKIICLFAQTTFQWIELFETSIPNNSKTFSAFKFVCATMKI